MAKRAISRPTTPPPGPPPGSPTDTSAFERSWPLVYSYLFDEAYEDGTRRTTSTLLFFVERGVLKCCLNDRDLSRSVFLACAGPVDALDALEAGLDADNLDWRAKRSS